MKSPEQIRDRIKELEALIESLTDMFEQEAERISWNVERNALLWVLTDKN